MWLDLDPTRPVIGNDGWEASATDIIGIHDYDANIEHIRQRYGPEVQPEQLFDRRRPADHGRRVVGAPPSHQRERDRVPRFGDRLHHAVGIGEMARQLGVRTVHLARSLAEVALRKRRD